MWQLAGGHTQKDIGPGLTTVGIGFPMSPGDGLRTITDVGTMMTTMDGFGCQDMTGHPHGWSGDTEATISVGHHSDLMQYSISISVSITEPAG
jgi:hypothetical protein